MKDKYDGIGCPFPLEGDGGGYLFPFDYELLYRVYLNSQHRILRVTQYLSLSVFNLVSS